MAGRPKSTASSVPESPTSEDTSSSEGYKLTIHYEHILASYSNKVAGGVVHRGVFTYNGEVIFDERFNGTDAEEHIIYLAMRYKFANEVKLGNVPPKVIKLEDEDA
jgi:hypothetical protein